VEAFFPKIAEFHKPPRHVKWREVNIAATLPGWTRFPAAQEWLDSQRAHNNTGQPAAADQVATSRSGNAAPGTSSSGAGPSVVVPALYDEFMKWRFHQGQQQRCSSPPRLEAAAHTRTAELGAAGWPAARDSFDAWPHLIEIRFVRALTLPGRVPLLAAPRPCPR